MSPTSLVALVGLVALVVGWLLVVFLRPGPVRAVVEWLATTAMYLTLASWFLGLSLEAYHEGRTWLLLGPFAFLTVMFAAGLCVSLFKTVAQLAGRSSMSSSATN